MGKITNITKYNAGMRKSIEDKLFFVSEINNEDKPYILLDYGCADGSLIKSWRTASLFSHDAYAIGYDNNSQMLKMAKENISNAYLDNSVHFVDNTDTFSTIKWLAQDLFNIPIVLNASSVIHEVYSYGTEKDIDKFWGDTIGNGFKYISIRDMAFNSNGRDYPVQFNDFDEFYRYFLQKVVELNVYEFWLEFCKTIENKCITYKDIVHFMLKYCYVENWDRECYENYFAVSLDDYKKLIPDDYEIVFQEEYILPFLKEKIFEDFGIDLDCMTHLKLLLRKKDKII